MTDVEKFVLEARIKKAEATLEKQDKYLKAVVRELRRANKELLVMKATTKSIVRYWFHSFKDGQVCWQGRIVGVHGSTHVIVELYDWFVGMPNGQKIVPLADVAGWTLYQTAEEMNSAYDNMPNRG